MNPHFHRCVTAEVLFIMMCNAKAQRDTTRQFLGSERLTPFWDLWLLWGI